MDTQRYQDVNVRQMFLDLGMPRYLTDMAIPMAWFLVGTTDPDSQPVMEIVKANQRGLRKLGFRSVLESGVVDRQTADAITKVSGPGWENKSWLQVTGDVLNATYNPSKAKLAMQMDKSARQASGQALGSYFEYEGVPPGPLPGYMVGLPPGPLGATSTDSGIELSYGQGVRNPKNMVPVDATTETVFRDVQRQINRNLSPLGRRIAEDGILGTQSQSAIFSLAKQKRLQKHNIAIPAIAATTSTMAWRAVTLAQYLKAEADARGISSTANMASSPAPKTDTAAEPTSSGQATVSGVMGALKGYAPYLLLAGAVAGGAIYYRRKKGGS